MKTATLKFSQVGALGLFLVGASISSAATIYWDGDGVSNPGSGTIVNDYAQNPNWGTGTFPDLGGIIGGSPYTYWNTASDGTGSNVAVANGDDLFFGPAGSAPDVSVFLAGHMNGSLVANSMTFGPVANFIFQKNPSWNGIYISATATADVAAGQTARFEASSITSGRFATKNGDGTLEFANGNFAQTQSYTINGGTYLVEQNNVGVTLAGPVISGAGKLAYRGNAAPAFGQEWDIRSANTFAGGFDLLQGQIRVGANSAGTFGAPTSGPLGTGTFTIGGEGNAVAYTDAGRTLHNNITVASGAGTKTLLNANGANTFWNGAMTLNDDLTVETVGANTSTHNIYNVTGTGGFVVGDGADATTLRLRESAGNSTYSGTTTVNTGSTVLVGEPGVTSENSVMNLAGGTFQSAGGGNTTQTVRGFTGNGTINTDANLTTLGIRPQTGDDLTFSGTWTIGSGTTILVNGVNGAGGVQNFDSAVGSITRLDVTNGAVLNVNSTVDASAGATDVVVETGGVLGGTGTITGDLLVGDNTAANAFLAPGNSIGTLSIIGDLDMTFKNSGTALMEIDRNGGLELADLLDVTGDITFDAASIIALDNIGAALQIGDTFDLFDWTGSLTGTPTFDFTSATLGGGLSWDTSSFGTDGSVSVVPEPSAYAFALGLLALAGVCLRRRRS